MEKETMKTLESYVDLKAKEALAGTCPDGEDKLRTPHEQYMEALQTLKDIEKDHNEFWDKQERREIEKKKNEDTIAVELAKQNVSGKRFILEVAKIAIPVLTGIISAVTVTRMQNKAGKFEESGTWVSKASQMTYNQAPKIWK